VVAVVTLVIGGAGTGGVAFNAKRLLSKPKPS
jgi:hypothetical protein